MTELNGLTTESLFQEGVSSCGGAASGAARRDHTMAVVMARPLLAAIALLGLVTPAAAVEVCKVVDLQLVTQTGEFFLAGNDAPYV